jgi:hypothetical protein
LSEVTIMHMDCCPIRSHHMHPRSY